MTGIDATQWSFCIAFAFLSSEREKDYTWALKWLKSLYEQCNTTPPSIILTDRCLAAINAATTLFPSATTLICIWHANKAVLAQCQPAFPEANKQKEFYGFWYSIINSPTEEAYTERLLEFKQKYTTEHFEEIGYIKSTWLVPVTNFIWTYLHE